MPTTTTHRETLRQLEQERAETERLRSELQRVRRELDRATIDRDDARSQLAELTGRVTVEYADGRPSTEHPSRANAQAKARAVLYSEHVDGRIEEPRGGYWLASSSCAVRAGQTVIRPRVAAGFD